MLNVVSPMVLNVSHGCDKEVWIADSGATTHMTNSDENMYDTHESSESVIIGDKWNVRVVHTGKLKVECKNVDRTKNTITLTDVYYVPDLMCNLLSLTFTMTKGVTRSEALGT